MRAEITLFSGMVVRIYKDRIVRASSHAGFASDADGLVKIDYAICALEHGCRRTSRDTRRVRTLITPGDLVRASRLRKCADINMLDVSSGDRDWHIVFRLARSRARVTSDTASMVDHFRPLNTLGCV